MNGPFNHYEDWKEEAERRGLQIENNGSGNKLIAHQDGDEKGEWQSNYGGAGFGWFY